MLAKAKHSAETRVSLIAACREDILFWVNAFLFTYDPREPETAIPFITYPYQDEAIIKILECIREKRSLVMQKSRDMGASWMSVLVMDHQATFEQGRRFVMMSYVADLVDKKGSPKALFWKLDFIHQWLPSWLRPVMESRLLGREYTLSGSTVDGVSTTERSTLGDRATGVFVDELSKYDATDADALLSNLPDVSPCRIYNFTRSTAGMAHPSQQLIDLAERGGIESVRMHWTAHPKKAKGLYRVPKETMKVEILDQKYDFPPNYPFQRDGRFEWHSIWFDIERKERANDRYVAEQLEIDDGGTSYTVFDVDIIKEYISQVCMPPVLEGDIHYDPHTGKPDRFDVNRGGPVKLWMRLDSFGKPPKAAYGSGADISLGMGATNSCFSAGRCDTGEKVLELATPFMKPDDFATKCVALCYWLGNTLLCWERQGPGETFGVQVARLRYSQIYWMKDMGRPSHSTKEPKAGWFPSPENKRSLLGKYRTALAKRDFLNCSRAALNETLEWIEGAGGKGPMHKSSTQKTLDPSGATKNHGDRVIADCLCLLMMQERGGGGVKLEPASVPGTMDFFFEQERRMRSTQDELYPNWQGKLTW